MKKNIVTYALIAAGVAAVIIMMRKRNRGSRSSVFADSPIIQTREEFEAETESAPAPSILETAGTLIKTIFPKKTAEQKTAIKQKRALAKQTRLAKRKAKKEKIGDISLLY